MLNSGDVSLLFLAFHRTASTRVVPISINKSHEYIFLYAGIINPNKTVHYFYVLENPSKVLVMNIKKFHYHKVGSIWLK